MLQDKAVTDARSFTNAPIAAAAAPLTIEAPDPEDAVPVHDLIAGCPPLDANSLYANVLQCTHHADTCAVAKVNGEVKGWVSGYRLPDQPDVYFLWQVAVDQSMRGAKLPLRMVHDILRRPVCDGVTTLHTTITSDNDASWGFFRSLARRHGADLSHEPGFTKQAHFGGRAKTEHLVAIRPLLPKPPIVTA